MFEVIREMPTLSKPIARYYFGCIMLSIEYLHANNIIYRDIKPENSVVNHEGKVHLIDLGTAKELTEKSMFRTFTIIGTPHYMAPEVF
jgi:cGMP-dependent protein kinase